MHIIFNFSFEMFGDSKYLRTFATQSRNNGAIAQLVEQRTENPCVPGSIPGGTTQKRNNLTIVSLFCLSAFI